MISECFSTMLDELVDELLLEVDDEKDRFHDLCTYERGIKSIPNLFQVVIIIAHNADWNIVLLTLLNSWLRSLRNSFNAGEENSR